MPCAQAQLSALNARRQRGARAAVYTDMTPRSLSIVLRIDSRSTRGINSCGTQINAFMAGYNPHKAQSIPSSGVVTPASGNWIILLRRGKQCSSAARAPFAEIE
jgi:hypothetical protein